MKKLSALMLLLLSYCSSTTYSSFNTRLPHGLTTQEVEQRHVLIYIEKNQKKYKCNGFMIDDVTVYTANHCVQDGTPSFEDGTALEELVSFPERDISILSLKTTQKMFPKAPLYERELKVGDKVYLIVGVDQKKRTELLDEFPEQIEVTSNQLLKISGKIIEAYQNRAFKDKNCEPYQLLDTYTIAAPGRLGFSGAPVLVQINEQYYLAGFVAAIERPGESHCNKILMTRNAVVFSAIFSWSYTQLVRAEDKK